MRASFSARLARLESRPDRDRIRYIASSCVLSVEEWQQGSNIANMGDGEPEAIMTEAEWVAAHCDLSGINRQ